MWYKIVFFFWAGYPARLSEYSGIAKSVHGHTRGVIASPGSLLLRTYFQLRYLIYRIATSTHSISPLTRPRSTIAGRALFFFFSIWSFPRELYNRSCPRAVVVLGQEGLCRSSIFGPCSFTYSAPQSTTLQGDCRFSHLVQSSSISLSTGNSSFWAHKQGHTPSPSSLI